MIALSVHHENLTLAITLPFLNISSLNFQVILNMNTVMMMPNSLGQGHICWSCAPFLYFFFLTKYQNVEPEGDTSVQLNTHLVYSMNNFRLKITLTQPGSLGLIYLTLYLIYMRVISV
jgi:hypothetical protein